MLQLQGWALPFPQALGIPGCQRANIAGGGSGASVGGPALDARYPQRQWAAKVLLARR